MINIKSNNRLKQKNDIVEKISFGCYRINIKRIPSETLRFSTSSLKELPYLSLVREFIYYLLDFIEKIEKLKSKDFFANFPENGIKLDNMLLVNIDNEEYKLMYNDNSVEFHYSASKNFKSYKKFTFRVSVNNILTLLLESESEDELRLMLFNIINIEDKYVILINLYGIFRVLKRYITKYFRKLYDMEDRKRILELLKNLEKNKTIINALKSIGENNIEYEKI